MENPVKEISDGKSAIKSNETSEEDEDDKSLDDMSPPKIPSSSNIDQSSGSKVHESTVPGTIVLDTPVPGSLASGNITRSNTTQTSREINHVLHMNVFPESPTRGVKRKLLGTHYEAKRTKRQKAYHYKNTLQIGGKKRKHADESDNVTKRMKKSFENGHPAADVSGIVREKDSGSSSDIVREKASGSGSDIVREKAGGSGSDKTASCSEPTPQSAETSDTTIEDDEDSEEVQKCPSTCVCQVGHSELPLEIERRFYTPEPLYKACLQRRIFSLANTQYMCCKDRCIKKYFRVKVMEKYLRHMNEDYRRSDLSVHEYSWGEWKG